MKFPFWQNTQFSVCTPHPPMCWFHPLVSVAPRDGRRRQGDFLCVSRSARRSAQPLVVQVLSQHSLCEPGARRLVAKSCPWLGIIWKYLGDRTFPVPTARILYCHLVPNKCSYLLPVCAWCLGKSCWEAHLFPRLLTAFPAASQGTPRVGYVLFGCRAF